MAEQTLKSSPDDPHANIVLAEHLSGLKGYRKAEPYAVKAFESGQLNARAGRLLGKIWWELGRPIATVDAWRVARQANPTSVGWPDYLFALRQAIITARSFGIYEAELKLRVELQALLKEDSTRLPQNAERRKEVLEMSSDETIERTRVLLEEMQNRQKADHERP